jgi:hypothetical protein
LLLGQNDIFGKGLESLESSNPKRPRVPEGVTIIFDAPQRKGKTLGGVVLSLDAQMRGRNIFSNIHLGFPHQPLQFEEIQLETSEEKEAGQLSSSKFWNGHIFIDELNFYFDARKSISSANIEFSAFLLQQKKQGCNMTGTTHSIWSLDVRLRENFDFLVIPKVFPAFPDTPEYLQMEIMNGPLQANYYRKIILPCKKYLGLYDTFATYNPFAKKQKHSTKKESPSGHTSNLSMDERLERLGIKIPGRTKNPIDVPKF